VNKALEVMFEYSQKELLGKEVEFLLPVRFANGHITLRKHFFDKGVNCTMGNQARASYGNRKDGSEFSMEIGLAHMEYTGSKHILASVIDISEQKRQEETLRESLANSERVNRLMQDREGRIIKLKQEVNDLCKALGSSPHYPVIASSDVL